MVVRLFWGLFDEEPLQSGDIIILIHIDIDIDN